MKTPTNMTQLIHTINDAIAQFGGSVKMGDLTLTKDKYTNKDGYITYYASLDLDCLMLIIDYLTKYMLYRIFN